MHVLPRIYFTFNAYIVKVILIFQIPVTYYWELLLTVGYFYHHRHYSHQDSLQHFYHHEQLEYRQDGSSEPQFEWTCVDSHGTSTVAYPTASLAWAWRNACVVCFTLSNLDMHKKASILGCHCQSWPSLCAAFTTRCFCDFKYALCLIVLDNVSCSELIGLYHFLKTMVFVSQSPPPPQRKSGANSLYVLYV